MASQNLKINITAKDRSKQVLSGVQGTLGSLKKSIFSVQSAFIAMGSVMVIRSIIKAGLQIENLGVQLEALTGSAAKGKIMLKQVVDYAKNTPFELSNIQQGITSLATVAEKAESMGISFEELMKITGNTATLLNGDFALAAMQIQRTFSAGIGAADLFRDKGIKAMAGFSAGAVTSIDESITKMKSAFGTGGKFGELTAKLALTLTGTLSNLKDTLFTIKTEIASGFFDQMKRELGDLKDFLEDNDQEIRELSRSLGGVFSEAIIKAGKAVRFMKNNTEELQASMGILLIAMGGVIKVAVGLYAIMDAGNKKWEKIAVMWGDGSNQFNSIKLSAQEVQDLAIKINKESKTWVNNLGAIHAGMKIIKVEAKKIDKTFEQLNKDKLKTMQEKFEDMSNTLKEGINTAITDMSTMLARSVSHAENLGEAMKTMARDLASKILAFFIEMVARQIYSVALEKLKNYELIKQLGIEKMISHEKKVQAVTSKGNLFSSILGAFGGSLSTSGGSMATKATGGAVSKGTPYMVGENGAEMFVPNQSGQITQSARGGSGGGSTTVNFNITTNDASGFDELLIRSRGTISALINDAVNERGQGNLV